MIRATVSAHSDGFQHDAVLYIEAQYPATPYLTGRVLAQPSGKPLGGVLVTTDRALYFSASAGGQAADWQAVPFYRLAEVILADRGGTIELVDKGDARKARLSSADQERLGSVYEHLRLALARQLQP